jgi:hypothetical protein
MSPTPDGRMVHTYAIQGDTAKAKAAYQDFLTLWKDVFAFILLRGFVGTFPIALSIPPQPDKSVRPSRQAARSR